jgi:hypothetical protein
MQELDLLYEKFKQLPDLEQGEPLGIDQSKKVVTFVAELIAEIVSMVKAKSKNGTKVNIVNILFRFGDDAHRLIQILNKFHVLPKELANLDRVEGEQLVTWWEEEIARAFDDKKLDVEHDNADKAFKILAWALDGVKLFASL